MNISFDSLWKFLAAAGLVVMPASFGVWQARADASIAALAAANSALAESAELSKQHQLLQRTADEFAQADENNIAQTAKFRRAGNVEETQRGFDLSAAFRKEQTEQATQMSDLKVRIDRKNVDAAGLSAVAAAQREGEASRWMSLGAFVAGMIMFVVGCVGWLKSTPSNPKPKRLEATE